MEQAPLTFEQWVKLYGPSYEISDAAVKELRDIHGIDAHTEMQAALRKIYTDVYLNQTEQQK